MFDNVPDNIISISILQKNSHPAKLRSLKRFRD